MSTDLVKEVRAVAGPEYQGLITDLFERIMLYDVQMTAVEVTPVGDQYDVEMDITARQFEADGIGRETEVPLDTLVSGRDFPGVKAGAARANAAVSGVPSPAWRSPARHCPGAEKTGRGRASIRSISMYDKTPKDNTRLLP